MTVSFQNRQKKNNLPYTTNIHTHTPNKNVRQSSFYMGKYITDIFSELQFRCHMFFLFILILSLLPHHHLLHGTTLPIVHIVG